MIFLLFNGWQLKLHKASGNKRSCYVKSCVLLPVHSVTLNCLAGVIFDLCCLKFTKISPSTSSNTAGLKIIHNHQILKRKFMREYTVTSHENNFLL
jgi:hypothetical protein